MQVKLKQFRKSKSCNRLSKKGGYNKEYFQEGQEIKKYFSSSEKKRQSIKTLPFLNSKIINPNNENDVNDVNDVRCANSVEPVISYPHSSLFLELGFALKLKGCLF